MKGCNSPLVSAFGNPLLDIHITIDSTDILDKHGLDLDCEKEVSREELEELQEICSRYDCVTNAGGSAQNTLRMFQWLLGRSNDSVMFGAVGQDEEGRTLETLVKNAGVCTKYVFHEDLPTGRCVALVKDQHRALVAHIGAADVYKPHHLNQKNHLDTLAQSQIVYIEGFFISHSFPAAEEVITFCKSKGIMIAFNLSSVYICNNHTREVLQLVENADIIFGNEAAYRALADASEQTPEVLNLLESNKQVKNKQAERERADHQQTSSSGTRATSVCSLQSHGKICISTNGPHPIKCKTTCGEYFEVQVPTIDSANVKDTTGAGDAFVAGFLYGMVEHQLQLEDCIKLGCRVAAQVIQHFGCQIPACSPSDVMKAV